MPDRTRILAVVAGRLVCAVPLSHVVETMRPLPIENFAAAPSFVLGLSRIRGLATPVVDLRALLGTSTTGEITRFASLRVGARQVALAVDRVLGVRALGSAHCDDLPALLSGATGDVVEAIAELDQELLLVLRAGHLCPEAALQALAAVSA
ncbi:MAG TPA: chemotaxis protein CheW [Polyangiaceae bacterium]|jgi:purine-binding chemotaxis protein CheW